MSQGSELLEKDQHLYKVLVVGDYAVGKTSLIRRYCHGFFSVNYKLTIGVVRRRSCHCRCRAGARGACRTCHVPRSRQSSSLSPSPSPSLSSAPS